MSEYPKKKDITDQFDLDQKEAALYFIAQYGQIDGGHHKAWVLDQVARILNGAEVKVYEYRWPESKSVFYEVEANDEYEAWVNRTWSEKDNYDTGIAP